MMISISNRKEYLEEVKQIIRTLIVSHREPMNLQDFQREYFNTIGEQIPFHEYGYPDCAMFLRDMPEFVRLVGAHGAREKDIIVEPVYTEKSKHIKDLISNQKKSQKPKKIQKRRGPGPQTFLSIVLRDAMRRLCKRSGPRGLPLNTLDVELSKEMGMFGWKQSGGSEWFTAYGFESKEEMIKLFLEFNLLRTYWKNDVEYATCFIKPRHLGPNAEYMDIDFSDVKSFKNNLKSILKRNPGGVLASEFPKLFRIKTGYELDLAKWGYITCAEMGHHLTDVFSCQRTDDQTDWILYDCDDPPKTIAAKAAKPKRETQNVFPAEVMYNLNHLMKTFPGGIWRNDFLSKYKELYEEDLQFVDHGFTNLDMLLRFLADRGIVHILKLQATTLILHPSIASKSTDPEKDLTEEKLRYELCPKTAMRHNERLPIQNPHEHFILGKYVEVHIVEVINPNFFWIRLLNCSQFQPLMDRLQKYYTRSGPLINEMPADVIKIGQFCACRMPEKVNPKQPWCRGLITGIPFKQKVEVLFVDHGIKSKVSFSEIRYLDRKFSDLPMLAFKASLLNIRPVGYGDWCKIKHTLTTHDSLCRKPWWSLEARQYFIEHAYGESVVARVHHISELDSTISVTLVNTNGPNDIWYHVEMIEEELAEWGEIPIVNGVISDDNISYSVIGSIVPSKLRNTQEIACGMNDESNEPESLMEKFKRMCAVEPDFEDVEDENC